MSAEFIKVARLQEIPAKKGKVIEIEGKEIALFRENETVYAIDNLCVHEGGPLGHGPVREGIVTCPWHLWRFDIKTGELLGSPSIKVACFSVKVEGDDILLDVSSLTAPLRKNREMLQKVAAGETSESIAKEYGLTPEEVERITRQIRVGERLIWLGELYLRQGAVYSQDLLQIPYRDLEGISYGAQEKLEALIELL
ncbi:MAG: Rieske 2Fe-2S domain-containing protein [Candidatus Manganitrophaceae bacterium]